MEQMEKMLLYVFGSIAMVRVALDALEPVEDDEE